VGEIDRADRIGAADMLEKAQPLQDSPMVSQDRAHELGLDPFPALPEREGESIMPIPTKGEGGEDAGGHSHDVIGAVERRIEDLSRTRTRRLLVAVRRSDGTAAVSRRSLQ
jgi:hypothetical protein